jgi:hypothetical protein
MTGAAFLHRIPLALKTQALRFVGPMQGLLTTRFPYVFQLFWRREPSVAARRRTVRPVISGRGYGFDRNALSHIGTIAAIETSYCHGC